MSKLARLNFFFFPFFLFAGIALQTTGLYLCAIGLPLLSIIREYKVNLFFDGDNQKNSRMIGFSLLVLFSIFPLCNFLNLFFLPGETIAQVPRTFVPSLKMLITSRITTAVFVSSLILISFSFLHKIQGPVSTLAAPEEWLSLKTYFSKFHLGVFGASVIWCFYLLTQYLTGFDVRVPGHLLAREHQMLSGYYRVFGFYGHPLSVAGVGLCFFVFYWVHFWQQLRVLATGEKKVLLFGANSLMALLAIYLSGGRTALAVAFLFLVAIPFFTKLSGNLFRAKIISLALLLAGGGFVLLNSGAATRLNMAWKSSVAGILADRQIFWTVYLKMFQDKPFWGHGMAFVEGGDRTRYYEKMGFSSLRDKFNAHNIYLETLANTGFIGFCCVGLALVFALRNLSCGIFKSKTLPENSDIQVALFAFIASIIANLMHCVTQNVFYDANVTLCYLALFWLIYFAKLISSSQDKFN